MNATIKLTGNATKTASQMLLAHNIEACIDTIPGLLSDRLDNPKFVGPAHPVTGLAPQWEGGSCMAALKHKLVSGAGMMGSWAHYLTGGACLTQNKRQVRAGETLVVELWARCMGEPVTIYTNLMPMPAARKVYASAEIVIDCPQFMRYTAELTVPVDDNDACLAVGLKTEGHVWIDQIHLRPKGQDLLSKPVLDMMASMQIPALRFPGGIVSTNYNWRHGTGPAHLRPTVQDAAFTRDWFIYYDFGTDEYLQLCHDQGITPTLTVNLGTGNADEAGAWAKYVADWYAARGITPPMIYWHIGNHPYVQTMAYMTSKMYAQTVRTYVPAIKAAYPNSRIVGVGPGLSHDPKEAAPEWTAAVLDEVGPMLDVIQCQTYAGQGLQPEGVSTDTWAAGTVEPREQMTRVVDSVVNFEAALANYIAACRNRGLKTNVGIAEWNYWCQASHRDGHNFDEPYYVVHAMFVAGMLHNFVRLSPDLEVAHFYNLINTMGIIVHRGADATEYCLGDVFRLYRPALPGSVLPLEIDSPALGNAQAVDAVALQNASGTYLFAVNRDDRQSAELDLGDIRPNAPADAAMMCGDLPSGTLATVQPPALKGGTITLPPLSLVRLRW
ncbi:MAG: hypothetical protein ABFD92_07610 [Planctomycetaceae bacterium]|nr:hypothetical protein [Planctomycetaceae bacterium]